MAIKRKDLFTDRCNFAALSNDNDMKDEEKAQIVDAIREFSPEINEIAKFLQETKTVQQFNEYFSDRPKPEGEMTVHEYLGIKDNSLAWWVNLLSYMVAAEMVDASFNAEEEAVRYRSKMRAFSLEFSGEVFDNRPDTKDWLDYTESPAYHELRQELKVGIDMETAEKLLRIAWLDGWNTGKGVG